MEKCLLCVIIISKFSDTANSNNAQNFALKLNFYLVILSRALPPHSAIHSFGKIIHEIEFGENALEQMMTIDDNRKTELNSTFSRS